MSNTNSKKDVAAIYESILANKDAENAALNREIAALRIRLALREQHECQPGGGRLKCIKSGKEEDFKQYVLDNMRLPPGDPVKMADITSQKEVKEALLWTLGLPAKKPSFFTKAHSPPKGLLLIGPPGCGKTMIVKAVADEYDVTVFNAQSGSLTSKWHGDSQKIIQALFKAAQDNAPSVILIDELDAVLHNRKDSDSAHETKEVNEFLSMMDGFSSKADKRVLVIGTTNRPWAIDEAGMRRFPVKIYVGPPDFADRFNFVKSFFKRMERNVVLRVGEIKEIAQLTDKYSYSALDALCRKATQMSLDDYAQCHGVERLLELEYCESPVVEKSHLVRAYRQSDSGIKEENLERLQQFLGDNLSYQFGARTVAAPVTVPLRATDTFARREALAKPGSSAEKEAWEVDAYQARLYEAKVKLNAPEKELKDLKKHFARHSDRQLFVVRAEPKKGGSASGDGVALPSSITDKAGEEKKTIPSLLDNLDWS